MRLIYTATLLTLFCVCFSCNTDTAETKEEDKKHIFAKFYVRYLQTEKELKAEASFKEGDTLATARPIVFNEVLFENQAMKAQNLGGKYGVRYDSRSRGPHRTEYAFQWVNDPNQPQQHNMGMAPIINFLIKEGPIDKKAGFTLVWKGEPLNGDQEMILLFTDSEKKAFPINLKGPTERPEVFIPAEKITGMMPGEGALMLVKKQLQQNATSNLTRISEMEFYSNNIDIEVLE